MREYYREGGREGAGGLATAQLESMLLIRTERGRKVKESERSVMTETEC